jgi:isopentenyldiphosphate isomerase/predicted phosphatase
MVRQELQIPAPIEQFVLLNKRLQVENFTKVKLFEGFAQMLEYLKKTGKIISICSNRDVNSLNKVLIFNNLDKYFDNIISCEEMKHEKPDPFCLNKLKDKYKNIPSSDFMYFGDSKTDAEFAKSAKIDYLIIDHYLNNYSFYSIILDLLTGEEDEILVKVNEDDKDDGAVAKLEAHSGIVIYHRAAVIAVFRPNGKVILGKRAARKMLCPNMWDFVAGHQPLGLDILQTAKMELNEEFGLKSDIKFNNVIRRDEPKEHEFEYLYYTVTSAPIKLEPTETSEYKNFDCNKLVNGDYDDKYSFVPRVKKRLKTLKKIWSKL